MSASEGARPPRPARRRHWICFGVVAVLVALDLWSKATVFQLLDEAPLERGPTGNLRYPLAGEWLAFMRNLNYGAAFGRFDELPHLLVVLRCVAVVLLSWLIVRAPRGQAVYLASLVLIVAGAAGNLYDNFFNGPKRTFAFLGADWSIGPVRDFIDVYFDIWRWHFPTFNVADSCITAGAVLLLLSGFGGPREAAGAREAEEAGERSSAGVDPPV